MRALSASDVIRVWESAQGQSPLEQALTILRAGLPEQGREALARMPVSERDEALLELRAQTLGSRMDARAKCPECAEELEFTIEAADLRRLGTSRELERTVEWQGFLLNLRAPTSQDLADLVGTEAEAGPRILAERCVTEIRREGRTVSMDELPEGIAEEVSRQLCEGDSGLETRVNLSCPACGHSWKMLFDIGSFFGAELAALTTRLLWEVHALARAYGWSEGAILSLSPRRRQAYLELAGHA